MTLFEINAQLRAIADGAEFNEETGEIYDEQAIMELQIAREDKLEGIACLIKESKAMAEAIKAEKTKLYERQKAEDPNPSQTQILLVNASLQSVEEFGDKDRAAVYFDVVMREDPNQEQPTHAREIWTFVRQHQTGNWQLDGLQQVE